MCKQLNCKPETLNWWLDKMEIVYGGQQAGKGTTKIKVSLDDIITNKVEFSNSQLRKRLIREGIFEDKCDECGLTEWLGNPITLELEHISGDRFDNRLENLRLLCPNCHSQTETFRKKKHK